MSIEEVRSYLHTLMWWLADENEIEAAWLFEDAYLKLHEISASMCREYADLLLPSGRRMRVRIALAWRHQPIYVRACLLLRWLLCSIKPSLS